MNTANSSNTNEVANDQILGQGLIQKSKVYISKSILLFFRVILCICAVYFLVMGAMLIFFPQVVTKNAGEQHPLVLGILRGAGGSVIISPIFYVLIALKPYERRWAAYVIAFANLLAVALDSISVSLGEYALSHAMINIPIEMVSFLPLLFATQDIERVSPDEPIQNDESIRHP